MNYQNFYHKWGFRDNFLSHQPLGPNEQGSSLISGRDDDLEKVIGRIKLGGPAVCIDGPVGSGKTSLANVAAYRAMMDFVKEPSSNPLVIPCEKTLQLDSKSNNEIQQEVLLNVAQTIIKNKPLFAEKFPATASLNKWINTPFFQSIEAQALGFGIGNGEAANETTGFTESGLPKLITQLLENIFPDKSSGGIVYIIDNIELLESSKEALKRLEHLRDTLFNLHGIRWILCGAYGILPGLVQSPRLEGCLGSTLRIKKIKLTESQSIFSKRIEYYKNRTRDQYYSPLDEEDFHKLYMSLGGNLRTTLKTASEYCTHLSEEKNFPSEKEAKKNKFNQWLKEYAESHKKDIERNITRRPIEVLFKAIKTFDGEFSQSDYEEFGFKSDATLRPHLRTLEEHGLIASTRNEEDKRRLTINVTGRGWLLNWAAVVE